MNFKMKSEQIERIYKFIMAIIITALVTFIVTTLGIYKAMGNNTIPYINF